MPVIQPRILIAEDEEVLRSLLCMYFRRENYLIEETDNGDDTLKKVLSSDYDLIILDVLMPGKDGISVLQELRAVKDTPVFILSVKGGGQEKQEAIRIGVNDYIQKPFSPGVFVSKVKEFIEARSRENQKALSIQI
ncbi:response regulator [Neobacillus terrae]|uniref:response regulator n=1 Tax=Neobacillus terrae TaxID=3034837 RepID=UPI001408651E|nr:response regulator [Neobacillus terrae]